MASLACVATGAFALALLAAGPLLSAPTFELLGDLPGGAVRSAALGVSADGTYVVGDSASASGEEAFVWDLSAGMIGLGDFSGGLFQSSAVDVSADGRYVVGSGTSGAGAAQPNGALLWTRGPPPTLTALRTIPRTRFTIPTLVSATAISSAGDVVAGNVDYAMFVSPEEGEQIAEGFRWTPAGGDVTITPPGEWGSADTLSPDGTVIAGSRNFGDAYRLRAGGSLEDLGRLGGLLTIPKGVSADGKKIVGSTYSTFFWPPEEVLGAFLWTEGGVPAFVELPSDGAGAAGISANGRVILDAAGGLYLDGDGPLNLRAVLAQTGLVDLRALSAAEFQANALSDDGLVIVGAVRLDGVQQAWRVRLSDSDQNGLPDELEQFACGILGDAFLIQVSQGSTQFAASRETLGYGDMISQYGRPWKPGTGRVPTRDLEQPAEFLRSVLRLGGCPDGGSLRSELVAEQFLSVVAFPAVREIHDFEMLLGNEALADARDPTIGLDGIQPDDLSDEFAFKDVPGIEDLLDEELALLRGRELPGAPADWVNESIFFAPGRRVSRRSTSP